MYIVSLFYYYHSLIFRHPLYCNCYGRIQRLDWRKQSYSLLPEPGLRRLR